MCSQVFLPNELGTSQNCWGRFVSFTTCFKNTFIPFETIWSLKKIPKKKYWHPKYKIKPMNCINSSPSLWVSHFFPLPWTQQKASQLFHPKTFMLRVEKWHKKWKKHQVVFPLRIHMGFLERWMMRVLCNCCKVLSAQGTFNTRENNEESNSS